MTMSTKNLPPGGGSATLTKQFIDSAADRKSLPTQVHVRPSNINCNSLRSDFFLTKYNPTVLIGNWAEQRAFDGMNSSDPSIKPKGFIFNPVESIHHDRKCPPTMGKVEPRYTTESRKMSSWQAQPIETLPDVNVVCDNLGKPIYADSDLNLYMTSSNFIGQGDQKVRFH